MSGWGTEGMFGSSNALTAVDCAAGADNWGSGGGTADAGGDTWNSGGGNGGTATADAGGESWAAGDGGSGDAGGGGGGDGACRMYVSRS